MTDFITDLEPDSCRQRLLGAGQPGYLAVGTDGTNELTAWAPPSAGGLSGGVFCRIALREAEGGTKITISTSATALARTGFMCWSLFAGWLALRFYVLPMLHDGNASFDRLLPPLGYVFSVAVIVVARVTDGRTVRGRVSDTIRRALKVRAVAAEPAVAADRASPGR